MASGIPSIDLHPEAQGGPDSDSAVRVCRLFIERQRGSGIRDMRIITGVGIRGDGTPRLRTRIENDVLPAYAPQLEEVLHEQGGAVLRLRFKAAPMRVSAAHRRNLDKEAARKGMVEKEERFQIARQRLDQAQEYLDEGDLRRVRLKLNQVIREFFPGEELSKGPKETFERALADLERRLQDLGL